MDMVADVEMMDMMELAMAMLLARAMVMGVHVDVMGRELTSSGSGVLSSLSKPHDQPYPTQPHAIKPSQSCSFTNSDTTPYKFPTVGAGDGVMGRGMPYQGHHTTVQPYDV